MLVWLVVIEPARSHDRVRQPAGAHEPLAATLPVVSLRLPVVVPSRLVTPMAVISAMRTDRPPRAARTFRTPP